MGSTTRVGGGNRARVAAELGHRGGQERAQQRTREYAPARWVRPGRERPSGERTVAASTSRKRPAPPRTDPVADVGCARNAALHRERTRSPPPSPSRPRRTSWARAAEWQTHRRGFEKRKAAGSAANSTGRRRRQRPQRRTPSRADPSRWPGACVRRGRPSSERTGEAPTSRKRSVLSRTGLVSDIGCPQQRTPSRANPARHPHRRAGPGGRAGRERASRNHTADLDKRNAACFVANRTGRRRRMRPERRTPPRARPATGQVAARRCHTGKQQRHPNRPVPPYGAAQRTPKTPSPN